MSSAGLCAAPGVCRRWGRGPTGPLTRSGIYKIVCRHAATLDDPRTDRRVSPHIFRHTGQTRSSPSSNPCDYAEPHTTITAPTRADVVPSA